MRSLGSDPKDSRNLTREEAFRAFSSLLSGGESEVTVGAFLTAMRWKGVTGEELAGFASAARMQAHIPCEGMPGLVTVSAPIDGHEQYPPLDAIAGIVAASAGARVLLVSDRCVPPRRGLTAANVLEEVGLSMTWDPSEAEDWVAKGGFSAISVAGLLPALVSLRRVRGDVVTRTPLSTVEKLLAPAGSAVVMGAQRGPVLGVAVGVIQTLGHTRGAAIQGLEGSVIPQLRRKTRGVELSDGHLTPLTVEPTDFGLESTDEPQLPMFGPPEEGYGPSDNPALVQAAGEIGRAVIEGEHGPARNAVLLGSSVILKASGRCLTLAEGVDAASKAIDDGAARARVEHLQGLIP